MKNWLRSGFLGLLAALLVATPSLYGVDIIGPVSTVLGGGTVSGNINPLDDVQVVFGTGTDAACEYDTTQTPDSLICGVSSDSNSLIIAEKGDMVFDFAHAQQTTPTVFVHSQNQNTSQWISLAHNGTNGVLDVGLGRVSIPDGISLQNSESLTNGTDGTLTVGRNDAGVVTINAADNDATAALTVAPGGAAAMTIGTSSTTATTIVSDDTGDAEEVHVVNSVGPADFVGAYKELIFCGENAENGTVYFGPATAPFGGDGSASYALTSTACDALDNATEATADAPISALATKIHGMYCTTDAVLGAAETIVFTLRTAVGNAVTTDGAATTVTCTMSVGETACRANTGTTTNIAAGATVAMSVVETSNNVDGDESWCSVLVSFP